VKKTTLILLGIILLGLLLRVQVAGNVHVNSDEAIYVTHGLGFIDSGRISVFEQSPTYYYLSDLVYTYFNLSSTTGRLLSIIGSVLSIILIYFITKKFYNKNVGLLAAFLFSISGFAIAFNTEMDMLMYFFILLSMYFLMKAMDEEKEIGKYHLLSMCSYVLAVMIKPLAVPAIVPLAVYYISKRRKSSLTNHLKVIGIFFIVGIALSSPVLTYNYILYKDQGIVDGVFSQYFNIPLEEYKDYQVDKEWSVSYLSNRFKDITHKMFTKDFFLLFFGLLGLGISAWRHKNKINYLFIPLFIVYFYFMGIHGGQNHYIIFMAMFSVYAAVSIRWLIARKEKYFPFITMPRKKLFYWFLAIIVVVNIFAIRGPLTDKAATNQLQEFFSTIDNKNTLVIVDPNMYTASRNYAFAHNNFVWADDFSQHIDYFHKDPSKPRRVTSYYVYCASGDCGWGSGRNNTEINQQSSLKFIKDVYGEPKAIATFSDNLKKGSYTYEAFMGDMTVPGNYLGYVHNRDRFFSHAFNYFNDDQTFDYIDVEKLNFTDRLLYKISRMLLILQVFFSIALMIYTALLLRRT
tara:strand:+ start:1027 stop:2748 length:1722 start_codon:yes stop_codon:yes gene_type:complete